MLSLRTFGSIDLTAQDGRRIEELLAQPKRLAVLSYLAVANEEFHRRDTLLALFWPELPESNARDALNQTIRQIRRHCGHEIVLSRGAEELAVNRAELRCDAVELQRLMKLDELEAAAALYRGDFLSGFHIDASVRFDEWLERERRELKRLAIAAFDTMARRAASSADCRRTADFWLRSLELDPGSAHATCGLMLALSESGDRAAALRAADDHTTFMQREYEAAPNAEVAALASRIRAQGDSSASSAPAEPLARPRPASAAVPEAPVAVSAATALDGAPRTRPTTARRNRMSMVVAVALLVGAVSMIAWLRRDASERFAIGMTRMVAGGPELEMDAAISPDGKLVAYAAGPLLHMRIFVRQVDGGAAVPISDSIKGTHRWPRWSPNGSQLLFVALDTTLENSMQNGVAYLVPYIGGTPEVAFSAKRFGVVTPAWAPDGKHIAYGDGNELVICSLDDGATRTVVKGDQLYSPAFSPDGKRLAYVSGNILGETILNIAASSIWTVPTSGGTPVRVTDSTHANSSPVWTADGRSIVYASNALGVNDLFRQRVSSDGHAVGPYTRLTTGLGATGVSMSDDQARAAYWTVRLRSHIWAATIPRSGATPDSVIEQITNETEAIEGLDVSRDGKWLVYDSDRSGNQDIYKLRIGQGTPIQLTHDPGPDHVPQWSPDGREIAYYSERAGNRDIRVMSAEGHDDRAVTTSRVEEHDATWSPDGRSLAYVAGGYGLPANIFIASRDSQGNWLAPRQLTNGTSAADGAGANLTRWSPDGRWIAFDANRSLQIISPQTGERRVLVRAGQIDGLRTGAVAWGSSADTVYTRTIGSTPAFWAVPLSGAAPRLVLRLNRRWRRHEFATDGRRLYFTLPADESDVWVMDIRR